MRQEGLGEYVCFKIPRPILVCGHERTVLRISGLNKELQFVHTVVNFTF